VGLDNTVREGKFKVNLLGEYNIGGDAFVIEKLFEEMGITRTLSIPESFKIAWPKVYHVQRSLFATWKIPRASN
jgi:nitrogenase molybdenum-iron protein alpha/beta subunit